MAPNTPITVAAQIAGSVGLAGSANIGTKCAMFEELLGRAVEADRDPVKTEYLLNNDGKPGYSLSQGQ